MDLIPDFIRRKQGKIPIVYELPELEPILKDTYGVIVYQEQVMAIANRVAGFSLGQADILRRAMGNLPHEIPNQLGMIRSVTKQAERALTPPEIPGRRPSPSERRTRSG